MAVEENLSSGQSVKRFQLFGNRAARSENLSVLRIRSKLYGDQARFFDAEKAPRIKHRKKGTVSMVNNGNDQHGSQVNEKRVFRNLPYSSFFRAGI